MKQHYCTIFIVDVLQNPEEVDTITSRIQQLIEDHGGEIVLHNPWGKRRLAYPIEKRTSGFYVEIEFSAPSRLNIPQIIEKEYRLNDRVLRYLTYVVTKEELNQRKMDSIRKPNEDERDSRGGRGRSNTKTVPIPRPVVATKPKPAADAAEAKPADEEKAAEPVVEEKAAEPVVEEKPAETPAEPVAEEKPDETVEEKVIETTEEAEKTNDEVTEDGTK
ncbi:MAG: 30S ribosomal protein S6 [Calditrichia bacterium]